MKNLLRLLIFLFILATLLPFLHRAGKIPAGPEENSLPFKNTSNLHHRRTQLKTEIHRCPHCIKTAPVPAEPVSPGVPAGQGAGFEAAGFISREIGKTLASFLWLRVDRMHHEEGHHFATSREIIPYIRMVTLLDRQFIEAYIVGAYHLSRHFSNDTAAIELLMEGLRYNKGDKKEAMLYNDLGQLIAVRGKATDEAILLLRKAFDLQTPACDDEDMATGRHMLFFLLYQKDQEAARNFLYEMILRDTGDVVLESIFKKYPEDVEKWGIDTTRFDFARARKKIEQEKEEEYRLEEKLSSCGCEHCDHREDLLPTWEKPSARKSLKHRTLQAFLAFIVLAFISRMRTS